MTNQSKVAPVEAQAVPTKEQANDALETLEGWDDGWGPDPRPKAFATLRRFIERSRPTPAAADLHQQSQIHSDHLAAPLAGQDFRDGPALSTAALDLLAERKRQQSGKGWTQEHDDEHAAGELALAAGKYASAAAGWTSAGQWPWGLDSWKPGKPRRMLVKAGALILAELERLDRAALAKEQK